MPRLLGLGARGPGFGSSISEEPKGPAGGGRVFQERVCLEVLLPLKGKRTCCQINFLGLR